MNQYRDKKIIFFSSKKKRNIVKKLDLLFIFILFFFLWFKLPILKLNISLLFNDVSKFFLSLESYFLFTFFFFCYFVVKYILDFFFNVNFNYKELIEIIRKKKISIKEISKFRDINIFVDKKIIKINGLMEFGNKGDENFPFSSSFPPDFLTIFWREIEQNFNNFENVYFSTPSFSEKIWTIIYFFVPIFYSVLFYPIVYEILINEKTLRQIIITREESIRKKLEKSKRENKNEDKKLIRYSSDFYSIINVENINYELNDVGGNEEAKIEFENIIDSLKKGSILKYRGFILFGPPGTGKTMLCRAFAKDSNLPLVSIKGSKLAVGIIKGVLQTTNEKLKVAITEAKILARENIYNKAIIFIDEFDLIGNRAIQNVSKIGKTLDNIGEMLEGESESFENNQDLMHGNGGEELKEIFATAEEGGEEVEEESDNLENIIFIITTNKSLSWFNDALIRPGRLEKHLYIDVPDCVTLEQIINKWSNIVEKRGLLAGFDKFGKAQIFKYKIKEELLNDLIHKFVWDNKFVLEKIKEELERKNNEREELERKNIKRLEEAKKVHDLRIKEYRKKIGNVSDEDNNNNREQVIEKQKDSDKEEEKISKEKKDINKIERIINECRNLKNNLKFTGADVKKFFEILSNNFSENNGNIEEKNKVKVIENEDIIKKSLIEIFELKIKRRMLI